MFKLRKPKLFLSGRYFFLSLPIFLADGYIQICATANKRSTSTLNIIKFSSAVATHTFTLTHFKHSFDWPIFIELSCVVFRGKTNKENKKKITSLGIS